MQLYPTMVLAGPDGKIHAFIEGYLEADRLEDQLKRAVTATTTTDWAARDFEQATKALAVGDYPRAVSLLKGIIKESGDKPVGREGAGRFSTTSRDLRPVGWRGQRHLEQRGFTQEAVDTLAEAVKTYAGTQAAADAATLMTGLAAKPEIQDKLRVRSARDLLAAAREEFRAKQVLRLPPAVRSTHHRVRRFARGEGRRSRWQPTSRAIRSGSRSRATR